MSIRGYVTCIYTTRRKCTTIFTGNIPASKGTSNRPSVASEYWYPERLFFPRGDNKYFDYRRVLNYSQCSEILIRHELRCDEVAINKYHHLVNVRIRFDRDRHMRFHIGPLPTGMTTFPDRWGGRGALWKRREYYQDTGRWKRYWRVWRKSDGPRYPC